MASSSKVRQCYWEVYGQDKAQNFYKVYTYVTLYGLCHYMTGVMYCILLIRLNRIWNIVLKNSQYKKVCFFFLSVVDFYPLRLIATEQGKRTWSDYAH